MSVRRRKAKTDRKRSRCICHACIRKYRITEEMAGVHWPLSAVRMILCPSCGNKRCPRASDHRHACSGSNAPGQRGSVYR